MRHLLFTLVAILFFSTSNLAATSAGAGCGAGQTDPVASAMDMCPVCSTIFDNKEHIKGIVALALGEVEAIETGYLTYCCQHTICLDCFNRLKKSDKPHCPQKRCPAPWGALSIGGLPPKTPFFIPLYSVNKNGDPLLIAALKAERGHVVFQLLLNAGVATNQQDALGRTALHLLVLEMKNNYTYSPPIFKKPWALSLLNHFSANPEIPDYEGKTPLMYATELRNYEIIKCILPYFKNPNAVLACRSFLKNAPLKRDDDIDQALCLTLLNNWLEKNLDFVDAEEEFCTIS